MVSFLMGVFNGSLFSDFSLRISPITATSRSPYFSASSSIFCGVGQGEMWMLLCFLSSAYISWYISSVMCGDTGARSCNVR